MKCRHVHFDEATGRIEPAGSAGDEDWVAVCERFKSKLVEGDAYRSVLVRYIDDNAIKAGLAAHAAGYSYGSAIHYARANGPRWLERGWVEEEVKGVRGNARYDASEYSVRFPSKLPDAVTSWIEDRLLGTRDEDFEDLVAPRLRQKNPDARRLAAETLADLSVTSRKFKQALLRTNMREDLRGA
jgi:hypothetical protein